MRQLCRWFLVSRNDGAPARARRGEVPPFSWRDRDSASLPPVAGGCAGTAAKPTPVNRSAVATMSGGDRPRRQPWTTGWSNALVRTRPSVIGGRQQGCPASRQIDQEKAPREIKNGERNSFTEQFGQDHGQRPLFCFEHLHLDLAQANWCLFMVPDNAYYCQVGSGVLAGLRSCGKEKTDRL